MISELTPLVIGDLKLKVPIIQGGMGVRVSTSSLAAAVANCGGGGTIASVGLPPDTPENRSDVPASSKKYLRIEIKRARELSPKGVIGVNIMVALSNYEDMVRTSVEEGADYIISGAGLPMSLPEYVDKGSNIKLIPLISSARGAAVIFKTWKKRYNRFPDAMVIEGPLSGGHIAGHTIEQLRDNRDIRLLEDSFREFIAYIREIETEYKIKIPVLAAGGIFDGKDIAKFLRMGANGVQMGSRFVATCECSVSENYKQLYLRAGANDTVYIKSPVGMPARVIKTKFVEAVLRGEKKPISCNYRCLRTCDPAASHFCIAKALIDAAEGDIDNAVVFAGANVSRITEIVTVKELIDGLVKETVGELNRIPG
ncbi:MAG TPA: nitronate monooxygenase family protein [Candidatus Omnitrophota bacterium]|nr:nitronate monooxygenase family protein [Candidatus Omnitrophota bacterium]HPS20898.1 nitronate monooxygenase family protein [Candidatus Omnitrophota bacterium]